jgi:hypothetical protein
MDTPPNREDQLAELIGRRLRDLPLPKAPRALAPRVRAAITARQSRPWWRKSWFHWPAPAQGSFLVLTGALVAAVAWYGTKLAPFSLLDDPRVMVASHLGFAKPLADLVYYLAASVLQVAKSAGQTFWTVVFAVLATIYLSFIGLGTVCYRFLVSTPKHPSL